MPAPSGWRWAPLVEVARLESGHTPSREHPEYWDGGISWIGIKDARTHHGQTITDTFQTVTKAGIANSAARILPKNTVCLSRTASVGYVTVMGREMATSQDFVNWICGPSLEPQFLKHLLIAENESLFRFGKGTTHTTIYYPEVKAFHICLPPLPEQCRIVAKLESLQARSRRAREAIEAVPPLLEKLRQSILAAAFRGDLTKDWREKHPDVEPASELLKRISIERRKKWEEAELAKMKAKGKAPTDDKWKARYVEPEPVDDSELPELPEGWCWARAQELARSDANAICAGPFGTIFKAKDFRDEGIPIIFLRHVARGQYLTHKPGYMDRKIWKELFQPYSVFGGELLVTKLGDPPGTCAIYPSNLGPAMVTPDVIKMDPDPHVTIGVYLMRYFNSDFARGNTFGVSYGTTRLRMTLGLFREMPVPVAPLDEQKVIVTAVERAFARVANVTGVADFAKDNLANLDSAILSKAFRGELVPQEPGDVIDAPGDVATESDGSAPGKPQKAQSRVRK